MPVIEVQTWTGHLRRKDLAVSLGISIPTLDRWRKLRRFPRPAFKFGRSPIWTAKGLRRWEARLVRK